MRQQQQEGSKQGLPEVLGGHQGGEMRRFEDDQQIYRVVGGRGRQAVQKSEAGMQTETASAIMARQQQQQQQQQSVDWKKAIAHSARVLSSQERAMDEYLRRQRAAAEHHIHQANQQIIRQQQQMHMQQQLQQQMQGGFLPQSVPSTPTGTRRSDNVRIAGAAASNNGNNSGSGGSLERNRNNGDGHFSDSEYGRLMLGSPMSSRKNYQQHQQQQPPVPGSPGSVRRDPAVFGSRSLPKGASASLNYGLMVGRIQQKRQQGPNNAGAGRTQQNNDGSLSDSNYATYGELGRGSQVRKIAITIVNLAKSGSEVTTFGLVI